MASRPFRIVDRTMLFDDVAAASERLAGTPSRNAKIASVADVLRRAEPPDVPILLPVLAGRLRQRRTGLGHAAAARAAVRPAAMPTLTVTDVDDAFQAVAAASGPGSAMLRAELWEDLLSRATVREQRLLVGLVTGDVRQGAGEGILVEAVATAVAVPADEIRHALTVAGDLVTVGAALLGSGASALAGFALSPGTPVAPMLAQSAPDVAAALRRTGPALIDSKLDGVRVQAHLSAAGRVRLFSRSLDDLSSRLAEVATAVGALGRACVLDGEVLLTTADGRPRPFQETSSRVAREESRQTPLARLRYAVFDVLHLDGRSLVDAPLKQRRQALQTLLTPPDAGTRWPTVTLTPAVECPGGEADATAAGDFAARSLAAGHEGVVVKASAAPYSAGRRGAAWIKVKPVVTLDLVILAAEWGSGRRRGWLSNLHLGARDPDGEYGTAGGFVMLGKTFKGLTDEMLRWQTEALGRLRRGGTDWRVDVAPELVVEIAFDGVQTSPRYPAGVTLRFARVVRHRPDKSAVETDTITAIKDLHRPA
jgi:DNA ligase-1